MAHVLVVCARRYNGHELWISLGTLQARGHTFDVVSTSYIIQDERTKRQNRIECTVDDLSNYDSDKYAGFMLVSGHTEDVQAYWNDVRVIKFIEQANQAEHPVAAICRAVPTIRSIASGRRVSFFPILRSRHLLQEAGAILTNVALSIDGNLLTAEYDMATEMWAEEFCNLLEGKPPAYILHDSGFVPQGGERKPIPGWDKVVKATEKEKEKDE